MLDKILVKEVVAPLIIILISFTFYKIVIKIISRLFQKRMKKVDIKRKNTFYGIIRNIIRYFILIIALLMILEIFGIDTKSLLTSLGIVGLVAGLALQDILKDFISGMSIILENQYSIGDTVTINGFKGEVIALGIKTTRLKSYTGEVKIIANHLISEVINHTVDSSLALVDISVSYEEDLDKVEKILIAECEKLTKELPNLKSTIECLGIQDLSSSSVVYRITAQTVPMEHFTIERILRRKLKDALEKEGITIPYAQVVVHNA